MKKPKRVLCKRSLIIGDPFYYDEVSGVKIDCDNRMLVAGDWYDVVYNENDSEKTFSIIDNQKNCHLFWMYNEEDKKSWPSFCKQYGPRDYAKWFYTPRELEIKTKRKKMTSKKGQFAVSSEWAKHLRKWGKRLFWKSERSKTLQHLNKNKKGEHE